MERRTRLLDLVGQLEDAGEGIGLQEAAVSHRVQVGKVEHGSHPGQLGRDEEDILSRSKLADAAHDLDPEGQSAGLALEPFSQVAELVDDGVERGAPFAAEQEAGVEDDELGTASDCDAGGMVEHADSHPVLLVALQVAEEGGDRRVDGERDGRLAREPAELLGPVVVHPETTFEVDLAGAVAALQQEVDGRLRALT